MATKEELYARAQELEIEGRTSMNKAELEEAVAAAEGGEQEQEVIAPMEDPVGTMESQREREDDEPDVDPEDDDSTGNEAEEAVDRLEEENVTLTPNGERAASGDPEVTWAEVLRNRR